MTDDKRLRTAETKLNHYNFELTFEYIRQTTTVFGLFRCSWHFFGCEVTHVVQIRHVAAISLRRCIVVLVLIVTTLTESPVTFAHWRLSINWSQVIGEALYRSCNSDQSLLRLKQEVGSPSGWLPRPVGPGLASMGRRFCGFESWSWTGGATHVHVACSLKLHHFR